jgi:2,3,4,5-tetrahydropyridine-2-carboxylate N-succinyltransferase
MTHDELRAAIEGAYELRSQLSPRSADPQIRAAVSEVLDLLDSGELRVAEKRGTAWQVNEWLKKAVLLSFRITENLPMPAAALNFYDKVPLKFSGWDAARFAAAGVRVVPPATVRRGAFVAANVVLMPSYVNIGAYVDSGGPPSDPARRSARTCTSPGAWASAACSSPCRPIRPSSRTTASSVRVRR